MQINYTGFRPNIKGVVIKKSYILDNAYHVEVVKVDKSPVCCNQSMNIKDYRTVHIFKSFLKNCCHYNGFFFPHNL